MSLTVSSGSPRNSSGLAYSGVSARPYSCVSCTCCSSCLVSSLATPKSSSRTWPAGVTRMFEGFRSRWITRCACAYCTASSTCWNSLMRSRNPSRRASHQSVRGWPGTYSIARYGRPSEVAPASYRRTMLTCSRLARISRSRAKRCARSGRHLRQRIQQDRAGAGVVLRKQRLTERRCQLSVFRGELLQPAAPSCLIQRQCVVQQPTHHHYLGDRQRHRRPTSFRIFLEQIQPSGDGSPQLTCACRATCNGRGNLQNSFLLPVRSTTAASPP